MIGVFIVLHTIIAILLVVVILMQSGRGGGLTGGFQAAESMFGAQTSSFMIRATTILSLIFLITCLSLAVLSTQSGKSIMPDKKTAPSASEEIDSPLPDSSDAVDGIIESMPNEPPVDKAL